MAKSLESKTNNIFSCKIYNNGWALELNGKLKVTDIVEENGRITKLIANFANYFIVVGYTYGGRFNKRFAYKSSNYKLASKWGL